MDKTLMQTHSRYRTARRILLFWTLFIGVGAVAGAAGMLLDPSGRALGMDAMLPYFQVLPFADVLFRDLTFSGWALLIVNGLTNLTAASLLLAKKNAGITLGGLFGVTLMLWIRIQFYMFPPNFMSTIYFMFGFAQAATGRARRSVRFGQLQRSIPTRSTEILSFPPRCIASWYSAAAQAGAAV